MIITEIWSKLPGKYFCISTKSTAKEWHDEYFTRDEFDEVDDYIRDNRDRNVYFCPHGLKRRSRVKEYAVLPTLLWADLDRRDPRLVKFRPSIAIESSPDKYVGIWECDRTVSEELNKRLTYALGADKSGWDLGQVLRVPGSLNYKYPERPRAKLMWSGGHEHCVSELERRLPRQLLRKHQPQGGRRPLSPVADSVDELVKRYGVKHRNMAYAGDRSKAICAIWKPMIEKRASLDEIVCVLEASWAWKDTLDDPDKGERWCDDEIKRIEGEMP